VSKPEDYDYGLEFPDPGKRVPWRKLVEAHSWVEWEDLTDGLDLTNDAAFQSLVEQKRRELGPNPRWATDEEMEARRRGKTPELSTFAEFWATSKPSGTTIGDMLEGYRLGMAFIKRLREADNTPEANGPPSEETNPGQDP
jgi:hypothetical protein